MDFVKAIILFLIILYCVIITAEKKQFWGPSPMKYIRKFNYTGEEHHIQTDDGYILTLHRVRCKPNPIKSNNSPRNCSPVLIVHGLTSHSGHFLVSANSLAYFLADAGLDVWLMNARGSIWSGKHIKLDPVRNAKEFWNFSWHEISVYDQPATIDYILEQTKRTKLFYIGHSQGGTTFFVMAAKRSEYNRKIQLAICLAPFVLQMYTNDSVLLSQVAHTTNSLIKMIQERKMYKIQIDPRIHLRAARFCSQLANRYICMSLIHLITQTDTTYLDQTMVPSVFWMTPSPCASRQFIHFDQNLKSGRFAEYDFGRETNLLYYASEVPPLYNLTKADAPVKIYYSRRDFLVPYKNILALDAILPNHIESYMVPRDTYDHIDYVLSIDSKQLVYQPIVEDIRNFENK